MYRIDHEPSRIIGEHFDSYSELRKAVESRPVNPYNTAKDITGSSYSDGHGRVKFDTTWERVLKGSEAHKDEFDRAMAEIRDELGDHWSERERELSAPSEVGQSVSVERAMAGHPMSFRRRKPKRMMAKAVKLFFDTDVPWFVGPSQRAKSGALVLMASSALEMRGHGVELSFLHCAAENATGGRYGHVLEVTAKGFGQRTSLRRLGYPACSQSAMFHVGCWWLQHFADAERFDSGWGRSLACSRMWSKTMREYARRRGGIYLPSYMIVNELGLDPFRVLRYIDDGLEAIYGQRG